MDFIIHQSSIVWKSWIYFTLTIEITDFEKTSKLYDLLKSMLKKLLDDLEIDDVNYWEWIAVLDTTLHGKVATKICEIKRDIDLLFQKSKLLNHYYEMKYFKKVNDNGEVVPVFKTNGDYFIQDLKFDDMKDYIIYQIDYFEHLDSFVNVFIEWADNVSTWFAEHIVEYLSSKKVDKSTFTPTSDSIASTSFSLNFQLNKYFEEHLAFRMKLEERYNIDDLLSYFPYMDTDCEKN